MPIYWPADRTILAAAIVALPNYQTLSDLQIATQLGAQTEVDDGPVDLASVRRQAIEQRIWGRLISFAERAFSTTPAVQALSDACRNHLSLFSEPEGTVRLVRVSTAEVSNALWLAMDADLTLMTASTGGGPVLTAAQAAFMRALGDRLRSKWSPLATQWDIEGMRQRDEF